MRMSFVLYVASSCCSFISFYVAKKIYMRNITLYKLINIQRTFKTNELYIIHICSVQHNMLREKKKHE